MQNLLTTALGNVTVATQDFRNPTPHELAKVTTDKIISVGSTTHPIIIEQARAFRGMIESVLTHGYIEAQNQERAVICARLEQQGLVEIAALIRSL